MLLMVNKRGRIFKMFDGINCSNCKKEILFEVKPEIIIYDLICENCLAQNVFSFDVDISPIEMLTELIGRQNRKDTEIGFR